RDVVADVLGTDLHERAVERELRLPLRLRVLDKRIPEEGRLPDHAHRPEQRLEPLLELVVGKAPLGAGPIRARRPRGPLAPRPPEGAAPPVRSPPPRATAALPGSSRDPRPRPRPEAVPPPASAGTRRRPDGSACARDRAGARPDPRR